MPSPAITAFNGKYSFLSNFAPCRVEMDGAYYRTVEHAYQAAKTFSFVGRDHVRRAPTAGAAKQRGRQVILRPDWSDEVRVEVMLKLLRAKFAPMTAYARQLEDTGASLIVEGNRWGDTFWGVCRGVGHNRLGELLMLVREENRA